MSRDNDPIMTVTPPHSRNATPNRWPHELTECGAYLREWTDDLKRECCRVGGSQAPKISFATVTADIARGQPA